MKLFALTTAWVACMTAFVQAQDHHDYNRDFSEVIETYNAFALKPLKPGICDADKFKSDLVRTLDPDQVIFSTSDMLKIRKTDALTFLDPPGSYSIERGNLLNIYTQSLESSLDILSELDTLRPNFQADDSTRNPYTWDEVYYARDRKERWQALVKYKLLNNLYDQARRDSTELSTGIPDSSIMNILHMITRIEKNKLTEILNSKQGPERKIFDAYANSLLLQADPHSSYFSKESFVDFRDHLSSQSMSYGIKLEQKPDGSYVIATILPGSQAWKKGKIRAGDIITQISIPGSPPLKLDFAGYREISEYIGSPEPPTLTLTIRDNDGNPSDIILPREENTERQNSVRAYVLNGSRRIGYIVLPTFYTSWDSKDSPGCARDVADVLYQLRKAQIEGLILDLRNNGGGSLEEAVKLAGLFIDFGALWIQRGANDQMGAIKDMTRGSMYQDPLVVLVNQYTASASEIVAAALQDYHRAVIIGDTTFGKATGQILVPVGSYAGGKLPKNPENCDVVKVTAARYYRVTGCSYQKTGVVPDIVLTGIKDPVNASESELSGAFPNDSLEKGAYFRPLDLLPFEEMKERSAVRVDTSRKFAEISRIDSIALSQLKKLRFIPLQLEKFLARKKEQEILMEEVDNLASGSSPSFSIESIRADLHLMRMSDYYADFMKQESESLTSDPYIEETWFILHDYLELHK